MKKRGNHSINVFFSLLRAGLWEKDCQLYSFEPIDYDAVLHLAEEQSVVGVLAAGLEYIIDLKVSKRDALQFVGQALRMEQRNTAMNNYISTLIDEMRGNGIFTLLVKGQGIAQCYERPLWRASGDVDFFLDDENYIKAKDFLIPLASSVKPEGGYSKHLGMTIDSWEIELHGTLRSGLTSRIDRVMDEIQTAVFTKGAVRVWENNHSLIYLLNETYDALYVFIHILTHFYQGGIGLRQFCDWCRLLWSYRDSIEVSILKQYLVSMRLVSEWKAFGAFAVEYLGLSQDAMPLYDSSSRWKKKADHICSFVMEVGNFGRNRDLSYYKKYPYVIRKARSFFIRCEDLAKHARIFPLDSIRFFPLLLINGLRSAVRGE